MSERKCLGWAEKEGKCETPSGSKWGPLWCQECDEKRIAYLDGQFAKISARFAASEEPAA